LFKGSEGQNATLYFLRNACAAIEILAGDALNFTLSKQMANSTLMIEKHYRKLTATMAVDKLA
jgi:hypothetical protein